jgi:hypothetical protein
MDGVSVATGLALGAGGSCVRPPSPVWCSNKSSWMGSEGAVELPVMLVLKDKLVQSQRRLSREDHFQVEKSLARARVSRMSVRVPARISSLGTLPGGVR